MLEQGVPQIGLNSHMLSKESNNCGDEGRDNPGLTDRIGWRALGDLLGVV